MGSVTQYIAGIGTKYTPYVPAYQMAAQHLVKYGKPEDARRALREGIEEARRQNLSHAAGEMAELLVSIGDS